MLLRIWMPSAIGFWNALRPEIRPQPPAHLLITAVAVADSESLEASARAVTSLVRMRPANEAEIRRYVATGEPLDKAGAYGLQGEGRRFVTAVVGSESNVIGLPLAETLELLRACGAPMRAGDASAPEPRAE